MVIFSKKTIFLTLLFSFISVFAVDYKAMSTDALMSLRGTIPVEELGDYGAELAIRVKKMDNHELEKYDILHMIKGKNEDSDVECSCNNKIKSSTIK